MFGKWLDFLTSVILESPCMWDVKACHALPSTFGTLVMQPGKGLKNRHSKCFERSVRTGKGEV